MVVRTCAFLVASVVAGLLLQAAYDAGLHRVNVAAIARAVVVDHEDR